MADKALIANLSKLASTSCLTDAKLAAIQKQFDAAQWALAEAQREFLEDATPESSVYIR